VYIADDVTNELTLKSVNAHYTQIKMWMFVNNI